MKQIPCIILLLLLSTALSAQVDMGLVRLQVDEQFLQAATVTDTGTQSDRTTYLDDGHLHYSGWDGGKQYASSLNANLELQKEEGSWFTRGGSVYGMLNETYSKSLGMENTVVEDNWDCHIAPSLRFRYRNDKDEKWFLCDRVWQAFKRFKHAACAEYSRSRETESRQCLPEALCADTRQHRMDPERA